MAEQPQPAAPQPRGGFFLSADHRLRPIWRALLYAIAAVVVILLSGIVAGMIVAVVRPAAAAELTTGNLPPHWFLAMQYALMNAGLLALAWVFFRGLDQRDWRGLGLWFYSGWVRESAVGLAIGAALIVVVAGTLGSGGWVSFATRAAPPAGSLALTLVMLLLAATFEEVLLRGYVFQRLVDSTGALGAVLITSVLFGALHIPNPSATPLSTANTVLAGVLLAVAYLKTRGLWLPIGLHFAWNSLMGPVLGLPVSGINMGGLFSTATAGPAWISGGAYGPEGGVVLTVAATAAAAWLWRARAISPSPAMQEVLQ
jgi:membrane protease YdiL (CAAX protease family)